MLWLGERRGHLSDWVTQRWVCATGRRVAGAESSWLEGPVGEPRGIGSDFFVALAAREQLTVSRTRPSGLVADFGRLAAPDFDPAGVHPNVVDFYARTSEYDLDSWAEWAGSFRPFGALLALLFSRRLQQLNVPLSGLDTSRGVTSDVIQLLDPRTGGLRHTAWIRLLAGSGDVLYAGSYSLVDVPGRVGACVKVVFPLPNGNAIVLMRPVAHADGSFSIVSAGRAFGDPGFYFTVRDGKHLWARYVRSFRESIHVYAAEDGAVRADHVLTLWGRTFLRLHYRLRPRSSAARATSPTH